MIDLKKTWQQFRWRSTRFPDENSVVSKVKLQVQDCKIEKLFHATRCRTLVAWGLLPIWAGSGWCLSGAASRARASLSETPLLHMSWGSLAAALRERIVCSWLPASPRCSELLTVLLAPSEQQFAVTLAKSHLSEANRNSTAKIRLWWCVFVVAGFPACWMKIQQVCMEAVDLSAVWTSNWACLYCPVVFQPEFESRLPHIYLGPAFSVFEALQ